MAQQTQPAGGIVVNPMGIPLDQRLPTEEAPSFSLWGPPGVGKSLEAARLGSRLLYVQTSPDALRMAFDLHRRGRFPAPPIHRVTLDERFVATIDPATNRPFGSFYSAMAWLVNHYIAATDAGRNEYDGIIFDEWNTILDRVYAEIAADPWGLCRSRKDPNIINPFAVMDRFRAFHAAMISIARRTRKIVGFVSHYQLPTYFDDDSPYKGQVKVLGGPKVPENVKAELMKLCAEVSAVIEMNVKPAKPVLILPSLTDAAKPSAATPGTTNGATTPAPPEPRPDEGTPRVLRTQLDEQWFRKVRGYGVRAEEPVIMGQYGLREVLEKAGFPLPKN